MCATPMRRRRPTSSSNSKAESSTVPQTTDMVADDAAEQELRRLRAQYGRRATILTPERNALGQAPTAQKNLLGA
ncbi:hypothetical protein [Dongia sp.]|uniref:hypothetical protein n=1 Tax=Dongia sp. TaxID=1977262 RepID=UPI0035B37F4C